MTDRSLSLPEPPEDGGSPGWYPDPRGKPRWWNGRRWTHDESDGGTPAPSTLDAPRIQRALAIVALSIGGVGTFAAVASAVACLLAPH